jgi:hypothetical protein
MGNPRQAAGIDGARIYDSGRRDDPSDENKYPLK